MLLFLDSLVLDNQMLSAAEVHSDMQGIQISAGCYLKYPY